MCLAPETSNKMSPIILSPRAMLVTSRARLDFDPLEYATCMALLRLRSEHAKSRESCLLPGALSPKRPSYAVDAPISCSMMASRSAHHLSVITNREHGSSVPFFQRPPLLEPIAPPPRPASTSPSSNSSMDSSPERLSKREYDTIKDQFSVTQNTLPLTAQALSLPVPPPKKSNANSASPITLQELRHYFDMPIVDVAKELGICTTLLKKICRQIGIKRWPHRQIRSMRNSIMALRASEARTTGSARQKFRTQAQALEEKLQEIIENPNGLSRFSKIKKDIFRDHHTAGKPYPSSGFAVNPAVSLAFARSGASKLSDAETAYCAGPAEDGAGLFSQYKVSA